MRFLWLVLATVPLSCRTATQITVTLRGVGVSCPGGGAPTIEQTGLLAKRKLQSPADMPELGVLGEECEAAGDSVVSLGSIVLVPAEGPGPVEVLALGALKNADGKAATAEQCRAEYERLFGKRCEVGKGELCESCIFARRSIAFVSHSKLDVTIDLDAACAGVVCDPSQTCAQGVCVSADTGCDDDGSCVLVNDPAGGGGAGPVGGAGGAGGDGAGGAPPVTWTPLWQPGETACQAEPSDLVAAVLDDGSGLHAFVAAGPCMLDLSAGRPPVEYVPAQRSSQNAYRAVAQSAPGDFLAFGDLGLARYATPVPFSSFNTQLASFVPDTTGVYWDVASFDYPATHSWTRTYQEGGTTSHVAPFAPSLIDSVSHAALFSVFPAGLPGAPITFAVYGSNFAVRRDGSTQQYGMNGTTEWSLWAEELAAQPGTFQVVAIAGDTDFVTTGRCTDNTPGGPPANCDFADAPLQLLTSAVATRKISAIWGIQRGGNVDIYAVGSEPWLGVATLPPDSSTPLDWKIAPLPDVLQDPGTSVTSVWVGLDQSGNEKLLVAGGGGVFQADPSALVLSDAP